MKKEKRLFPTTDFYCVSKAIVITIDLYAALLYGYIWSMCGLRNGYCNASYATMAKELGISKKTVERRISELIKHKLIKDISESKFNTPGITRRYVCSDHELQKLESNVPETLVEESSVCESLTNVSESTSNVSQSITSVSQSQSSVCESVKVNTEINKELNTELNKEINKKNFNFDLSEELHKHRENLNKQEEKENIFSHSTEQIKAALTKAQGQTYLAAMELGEDFCQLDDFICKNPELYDFQVSLINATEYESPF